MKFQKLGIIVACLAAVAVASAEDAMMVMRKQAADFDRAMMTKDMKWFETVAAADYHEIDGQGHKVDRKTAIAMMKQQLSMGSIDKIKTTVVSAKQKGDKIVCVSNSTMSGKMMMSPQAKKQSKVDGNMLYEETWTKNGNKWMIHQLKTIKQTMTVDGKPFKM